MKSCKSILMLVILLTAGCSSDKGTDPNEPGAADSVRAGDYFFVRDTTEVVQMLIRTDPVYREPFLEEEAIIGEPFSDLNGNGIYDLGIDGFVRSYDPTLNQDLNYNGLHDGPENTRPYEWSPPIPFDDLDGNGILRYGTEWPNMDSDCPYAPFVDWNGNGIWDSITGQAFDFGRFHAEYSLFPIPGASFAFGPIGYGLIADTHFTYHSDSGITYYLPHKSFPARPPFALFIRSDSFFVKLGSLPYLVPMADSGLLGEDSGATVIVYQSSYDEVSVKRKVLLDTHFVFEDTLFQNLVCVKFDSISSIYRPSLLHKWWEFYFDRGQGLVLCRTNYWSRTNSETNEYYFHREFTATFPLPLSKVGRQQP